MKCDKCDGKGYLIKDGNQVIKWWCDKCLRTGEVNWIENIFGKPEVNEPIRRFAFTQNTPSEEWHIVHNNHSYNVLNIKVYDDSHRIVLPYNISLNHYSINIRFSEKVSGIALVDY
jgi:hypothetical protein